MRRLRLTVHKREDAIAAVMDAWPLDMGYQPRLAALAVDAITAPPRRPTKENHGQHH